jgi:hypothetical protein
MLRLLLFILLLPSLANAQRKAYTHYKEHFLRGRVKTMYTHNYHCDNSAPGKYTPDSRTPYNTTVYHFNTAGNITSARTLWYLPGSMQVAYSYTYHYHYTNYIFTGYDVVTSNGLDEFDVRRTWLSDSTYIDIQYREGGLHPDTIQVNINNRRPYAQTLLHDRKGNRLKDFITIMLDSSAQCLMSKYEYTYY